MENIIPISIVAVVVFVVAIFWLRLRVRSNFEQSQREMKKLRQDVEIIQAQLQQAQFFNLDVSGVEKKVEEDIEQMDSFVREELGAASSAIQSLSERIEELEDDDDVDESDERIDVLEERIKELEDRLKEIEMENTRNL